MSPIDFPSHFSDADKRRWFIESIANSEKRLAKLKELDAPEVLLSAEQGILDRKIKAFKDLMDSLQED